MYYFVSLTKKMTAEIFDSIVMLTFGKTKVTKKKEFLWRKKLIKIWDVDVDNTVISKLIETKYNSKYSTGNLDDAIRPLVLILTKMTEYVITF